MNSQEEDQIIARHTQEASAEIAAIRGQTAESKKAQAIQAEMDALAAQLAPLQKFPSRYRAEITQLGAQLDAKQRELEILGVKKPNQPTVQGRVMLVRTGMYVNYDPRYSRTTPEE